MSKFETIVQLTKLAIGAYLMWASYEIITLLHRIAVNI